jgi:hypothetical protein
MTTDHPQKITFGECAPPVSAMCWSIAADHHCSHHIRISADR